MIWSGGKDSTLSCILLAKNGFEVRLIHLSVNARAEQAEMQAVTNLTQVLGITYETVVFDFPQYLELTKRYGPLGYLSRL